MPCLRWSYLIKLQIRNLCQSKLNMYTIATSIFSKYSVFVKCNTVNRPVDEIILIWFGLFSELRAKANKCWHSLTKFEQIINKYKATHYHANGREREYAEWTDSKRIIPTVTTQKWNEDNNITLCAGIESKRIYSVVGHTHTHG